MKQTALFLGILLIASAANAQDVFRKHGFEKETLTLSKGRYKEVFTNDETVQVGTVLLNTKTNEVVRFLEEGEEEAVYREEHSSRFLTIDPLAEKYPSISPYVYCLNNPIRYIDPDGRDVWELDEMGNIVNRIEDKTQDAFYMVSKDADGNYQRTYTTDEDGNITYNAVSFDYGTITAVKEETVTINGKDLKMTSFSVKGDNKATQLFEFMADPQKTTKIEWSHMKVGKTIGDQGVNLVATSHELSSVTKRTQGYSNSIREDIHNHPTGDDRPSSGDINTRNYYLSRSPNAKFFIYTTKHGYRPYTTSSDVIRFRVRDYAK